MIELEDVKRLRLEPGDTIVIKVAHEPTEALAQIVKASLEEWHPGHRVIFLGPGSDIEVLSDK